MKPHSAAICLASAIMFLVFVVIGLYSITHGNGFAMVGAWISACVCFCTSLWYGNGGGI